jgi:hypothetical protein
VAFRRRSQFGVNHGNVEAHRQVCLLDELWSFVGKKQARVQRNELFAKGDQHVFIAMAGTQKAIVSFRIGKRDHHGEAFS